MLLGGAGRRPIVLGCVVVYSAPNVDLDLPLRAVGVTAPGAGLSHPRKNHIPQPDSRTRPEPDAGEDTQTGLRREHDVERTVCHITCDAQRHTVGSVGVFPSLVFGYFKDRYGNLAAPIVLYFPFSETTPTTTTSAGLTYFITRFVRRPQASVACAMRANYPQRQCKPHRWKIPASIIPLPSPS